MLLSPHRAERQHSVRMEADQKRLPVLLWGHRSSFQTSTIFSWPRGVPGPHNCAVPIHAPRSCRERERQYQQSSIKHSMYPVEIWKAKGGWQSCRGMWTMNMAVLHLPVYTVLLVGYVHAGITDDVTPRLTFSYSKYLPTSGTYSGIFNYCEEIQRKARLKVFLLPQMHPWPQVETLLEFITWNLCDTVVEKKQQLVSVKCALRTRAPCLTKQFYISQWIPCSLILSIQTNQSISCVL